MGIISVFMIAFGLAMDAFAVSVSNGIALRSYTPKDGTRMASFFGLFQFIMPIIGWFLGSSVRVYIETVDHWIAFLLLAFIGGNMIKSSFECEKEDGVCEIFQLTNKKLTVQAVATSIDALAVGISFAVLEVDIISAAAVIGVVCFVISFLGSTLGKRLGEVFKGRAELLGGVILIGIGVKIVIEHLFL